MLVQKQFSLTLVLNWKRNANLTKMKKQSGKLILKRKLSFQGEMLILSEIKRNKDPKNKKNHEGCKKA